MPFKTQKPPSGDTRAATQSSCWPLQNSDAKSEDVRVNPRWTCVWVRTDKRQI